MPGLPRIWANPCHACLHAEKAGLSGASEKAPSSRGHTESSNTSWGARVDQLLQVFLPRPEYKALTPHLFLCLAHKCRLGAGVCAIGTTWSFLTSEAQLLSFAELPQRAYKESEET